MTIEIALFIAAGLVLLGFWLGWKIVRGRMRGDDKVPPQVPAPAPAPAKEVEAPAVQIGRAHV